MLSKKDYWGNLDNFFSHTIDLIEMLDLKKNWIGVDPKKKLLSELDEIKKIINEQIDFNEKGGIFFNKRYSSKDSNQISDTNTPTILIGQEVLADKEETDLANKKKVEEHLEINDSDQLLLQDIVIVSDAIQIDLVKNNKIEQEGFGKDINEEQPESQNNNVEALSPSFEEKSDNLTDNISPSIQFYTPEAQKNKNESIIQLSNAQSNELEKINAEFVNNEININNKDQEVLAGETNEQKTQKSSNQIISNIDIKKSKNKSASKIVPPKVTFSIPNGKIKEFYKEKITIKENIEIEILYESITFSENNLGISVEDSFIVGLPQKIGSSVINFNYKHQDNVYKASANLIIVADPKDLWEINEPATASLFPKEHGFYKTTKFNNNQDYKIIAASRRGRSHEHNGSFRDDHFEYKILEHDPSLVLLSVADGAGSAKYSREGSRLAAEQSINFLSHKLVAIQAFQDLEKYVFDEPHTSEINKSIVENWNTAAIQLFREATDHAMEKIRQKVENTQSSFRDFATTLQIVIVKHVQDKRFISSFWVGDGAVAVYNQEKIRLLGQTDGGDYVGQTVFLSPNLEPFHQYVSITIASAQDWLFLMSDGISDPYFETDSELSSLDSWTQFYNEYKEVLNSDIDGSDLNEKIHFFKKGHHDDRTLLVLLPHNEPNLSLTVESFTDV
ncbi:PP2C family serine/threonine-protein phosphatase [Acinetobacter sp. TY1]|uniref:PP2C family serine/threonine-protein phosphatase n=1 Tax=unclassified Acinetobacter TaxID=196816 RepID=UPI0015967AED|nr:PP2C family serine/threonine-protein phosphatase [Acinetobacter sp. NEB 394]QKY89369.1 protein phosphatase 2C domain-containing protein [Acinetobacter sp. NEB 394]